MRNWKFNHIDFSTYPYYGGDDLGVYLSGENISVKIWAPTAKEVELSVYKESNGGKPIQTKHLQPVEKGCWELKFQGDFKGQYYTFRVNDGNWLNETPGIDARAVGTNGNRGLFFDPADTNPTGWKNDIPVQYGNTCDAIIYELHVRDFSMAENSGMKQKGKFLAFAETGVVNDNDLPVGIDHLKELGITHVHLLPVSDFYTIDENHPQGKYNWGYDPLNFNTPEGSYASNPDTISRIIELKQLVMALHHAGIGVIMDVVYNHTGYTRKSWFNQTVPGYYYRQNRNGTFSNASGCGNEIASERSMVRKYIVDSLCYWANEFHIDGFRFDLMGVFDLETMHSIRDALNKIHPGIILYGEGWTADKSPMSENERAVKINTARLNRVACFNDDLRDALKGNNFDGNGKGFVNGKTLHEEAVKFGIVAACYHPQIVYNYVESSNFAWASEPWQCVNYVSCHDNYTLYDKLVSSCPKASKDELIKMQKLAGAIILTSQGIPFLHAGVEFCRTKMGNHNSYKSPDYINQLDWDRKSIYLDVFNYYKQLIQLRKDIPALRMHSANEIREFLKFSHAYQLGVVSYSIENFPGETRWSVMQVVFNASNENIVVELPKSANWKIIADENSVDLKGISHFVGNQTKVAPVSMQILVCRSEDGQQQINIF